MPAKKDNPRNTTITVAITEQDKAALKQAAATSKGKASMSDIAYEMMQRGNLRSLVGSFVANQSSNLPTASE